MVAITAGGRRVAGVCFEPPERIVCDLLRVIRSGGSPSLNPGHPHFSSDAMALTTNCLAYFVSNALIRLVAFANASIPAKFSSAMMVSALRFSIKWRYSTLIASK